VSGEEPFAPGPLRTRQKFEQKNNQKDIFMPTQLPMPKIIYGTAWKKDRTADLVVKAITLGFRGIDTACQPKHYNSHDS
jgi:hypothetical protein